MTVFEFLSIGALAIFFTILLLSLAIKYAGLRTPSPVYLRQERQGILVFKRATPNQRGKLSRFYAGRPKFIWVSREREDVLIWNERLPTQVTFSTFFPGIPLAEVTVEVKALVCTNNPPLDFIHIHGMNWKEAALGKLVHSWNGFQVPLAAMTLDQLESHEAKNFLLARLAETNEDLSQHRIRLVNVKMALSSVIARIETTLIEQEEFEKSEEAKEPGRQEYAG